MGEIADMMIDGTLDFETGEVLDRKSPGYPRTKRGAMGKGVGKRFCCKVCGKRFKTNQGRSQHIGDKHGKGGD